MSSDMKRMELLSMNFSDLVERCLVAETMWQENIDKNDTLRAENEKLKAVLENIVKTANGFKRWSELGVKADNGETIIDMIENTAQQALKDEYERQKDGE